MNQCFQTPTTTELDEIQKTSKIPKFLQFHDDFSVNDTAKFFISESPKSGTLAEYIKTNGPLNEVTIRSIMNQLLEAADFLQRNQLAHLCFDTENIFIENEIENPETVIVVRF